MSTIDPNSSAVGQTGFTQTGSTGSTNLSSTSFSAFFADTLTTSDSLSPTETLFSPVLPLPNITILAFSQAINSSLNDQNFQNWIQEQDRATSFNGFYVSGIQSGIALFQFYAKVFTLYTQQNFLYTEEKGLVNILSTQLQTEQNQIETPDAQQTFATNEAIFNYNNAVVSFIDGGIDQATFQQAVDTYNSAVASYNNYVAGRNASSFITQTNIVINFYNQQTASINDQIATLNTELAGTGLPTMNQQDLYLPPNYSAGTAPLQTLSPVTVTDLQTVGFLPPFPLITPIQLQISQPDSPQGAIAQQALPIIIANLRAMALNQTFLSIFSSYNDFLQFAFKGKNPTLPASFATPYPSIFLGGDSGPSGLGSGVSIGTMIGTLNNPLLSGILSQATYLSNMSSLADPLSPDVRIELQLFSVQFLQQIGLFSALESMGWFNGTNLAALNNSPTLDLALSLGFANQTSLAVSSGSINDAIFGILSQSFPNVPANSLETLAQNLASATQLLYLETSLSQMSQALGIPELFNNVYASLALADNTLTGPTLTSVLTNQLSQGYLKEAIANQLQAQDQTLTQENAQIIANQAVNAALTKQSITDEASLQTSINTELINQGVNAAAAQSASTLAADYTRSEILGNNLLDAAISQENLNAQNLASRIQNQNILNEYQSNATTYQGIISNALSSATQSNEQITNRTLRDRISNQLIAAGLSQGAALEVSTLAVTPVSTPPPPVSLTELNQNIIASATSILTPQVGATQAQALATQLADLVTGDSRSLRNLLNDQLTNLYTQNDATISNLTDDAVRLANSPNLSLYTFNQFLMDPGKMLVHSFLTGLMYGGKIPSNYQHPLDIQV